MPQIQFWNPNKRLEGERRSKLLDPRSELYQELTRRRDVLKRLHGYQVAEKRMDFHVELLQPGDDATEALLVKRAQELEGKNIDMITECMGKALVIGGPYVDGYGNTHITVAYYPKGIPDDTYEHMAADA